jgi:uncharacterized membrane protein
MSNRTVPPNRALSWIGDAINLILKNPVAFALIGLIMTVIALVPILGALALLIVGPALYGGIVFAAREQDAGRSADFQHLFEAFRQDGKLSRMITLCLPGVLFVAAAMVIGILVMLIFGMGAIMASGGQFDPNTDLVTLIGVSGAVTLGLLLLPVAIAVSALLFFSVPRVMLDDLEPFPAMKESWRTALANIGAFLVAVLVLGFARFVVAVLLSALPVVISALVLGIVFTPLIGATLYCAWRDMFARAAAGDLNDLAPPPPPSGGLEVAPRLPVPFAGCGVACPGRLCRKRRCNPPSARQHNDRAGPSNRVTASRRDRAAARSGGLDQVRILCRPPQVLRRPPQLRGWRLLPSAAVPAASSRRRRRTSAAATSTPTS